MTYSTEQFNADVQKLRDLMDKCEALEKKKVIKVGTNVKSKIHDDLTGHVVICQPSKLEKTTLSKKFFNLVAFLLSTT